MKLLEVKKGKQENHEDAIQSSTQFNMSHPESLWYMPIRRHFETLSKFSCLSTFCWETVLAGLTVSETPF